MPEKTLSNCIWETRKIRINTEQRLLKYLNISDWLIPWVSANLIIINLIPNNSSNQYISIFTIYLSILILIVSIILNSKQFGVRASNMKAHYIELSNLLFKIKSDEKKITEYNNEYNKLLNQIENHSEIDYLKAVISLENDDDSTMKKPTLRNKIYYYFRNIVFYFLIACLFILPIIPIIVLLK